MVFLFLLVMAGFALLIDYFRTRHAEKEESFSSIIKNEKKVVIAA